MEVVGQLEVEHRVVNLPRPHLLDVLLGPHLVGVFVEIGDAPSEHDGLEVELLTQFLAILIHAAAQSQPTIVGVYEHLDAVKDTAVGVVGVKRLVACHLGIGVVALHHVILDDDAQGAAHDLVIGNDHHLALGEDGDELPDLLMGPKHVAVSIDAMERTRQLVIIGHLQVAKFNLTDLPFLFHKYYPYT